MAVRPIRRFPDPLLRRKAKRVTGRFNSLRVLVQDMIETMHEARGAGLAAPQIGILLRLVVLKMPEEEPFCLINPGIVKRSGEREVPEGCLSLPGYVGTVRRSATVTVKGSDLQGKEVRIKAEGLLAQTLEHELDHLNGVLYIDRLKEGSSLEEVKPREAPSGANGEDASQKES